MQGSAGLAQSRELLRPHPVAKPRGLRSPTAPRPSTMLWQRQGTAGPAALPGHRKPCAAQSPPPSPPSRPGGKEIWHLQLPALALRFPESARAGQAEPFRERGWQK